VLYDELKEGAQVLLWNHWARTRTIGGKPEDGGEPRREGNFYVFTSTGGSPSVRVALPTEILGRFTGRDLRGRAPFWNVTITNTKFSSNSNGDVEAVLLPEFLNPNDLAVPRLIKSGTRGKANSSTFWVPS
jgi:hypothetical protein